RRNNIASILQNQYTNNKLIAHNELHLQMFICSTRGAVYEIIRHLGNWDIFDSSLYLTTIHNLNMEIYKVDFQNITINNNLRRVRTVITNNELISNDVCCLCNTPLYDDIYLLFLTKNTKQCMAVCRVCMHSRFEINNDRITQNDNGFSLAKD